MKLFNKKDQKGFTIIEVMIVLAIAGLIIGVVLVAIPQLQRNQRNTARKSVLSRIKTEVDNYAGNNNGTYPANLNTNVAGSFGSTTANTNAFLGRYLGATAGGGGVNINDPSTGVPVTFSIPAAAALATLPTQGQVFYYNGAVCSTDGAMTAQAGRFYAVSMGLEGGAAQCLDNK
jgi:type IV pilus assembly protein PilA